jgi:uroporphyrinogen-III synthase
MAKSPLIWLTRPRDDSTAFAEELAVKHIASIIAPVMRIVQQPLAAIPAKPNAILLTSRHAAFALASLPTAWRSLPVYCVGRSTAQAASEHYCSNIHPGSSNVLSLLPKIVSDLGAGARVLYLAGEDTSVDVVHLLGAHGVHVTVHLVYRALAEHALDTPAQEALRNGTITAVAFFSPRSAHITADLIAHANLLDEAKRIEAFCFSPSVAVAARKLGWKHIHTCHTPTRYAMRELIISTAEKPL